MAKPELTVICGDEYKGFCGTATCDKPAGHHGQHTASSGTLNLVWDDDTAHTVKDGPVTDEQFERLMERLTRLIIIGEAIHSHLVDKDPTNISTAVADVVDVVANK